MQNNLVDLRERILSAEMYLSKDKIIVNSPPPCQNNLMDTIIFFSFNDNLQSSFTPADIKACHYLEKPGELSAFV